MADALDEWFIRASSRKNKNPNASGRKKLYKVQYECLNQRSPICIQSCQKFKQPLKLELFKESSIKQMG
jgi:hypothetical protein